MVQLVYFKKHNYQLLTDHFKRKNNNSYKCFMLKNSETCKLN
jgi:hypothetical protein